jgi:hypothetical protein
MEEPPVSTSEVLRQIENTKNKLNENKNHLNEHIYNAMTGLSKTILNYIDNNGKSGWASQTVDSEGKPIWNEEQSKTIEESLPSTLQKGGMTPGNFHLTAESSLISPIGKSDISLDSIAENVSKYISAIDETNRDLAKAVGPVAFINKMEKDPSFGPVLPYMPFRLQFPARLILPVLNSILEASYGANNFCIFFYIICNCQ